MSSYIKDLGSVSKCASQVNQVLQTFRHYNKYSLNGLAPSICSKLKDIPIEIIDEALSKYQNKADAEKHAPHPNYFLTICFNLSEKQRPIKGNEDDLPPLITGRML